MDFEAVLRELLAGFEARGIRYGAVGGFALGLLKAPRNTGDLDFLVHRDDLPAFEELMTALGYRKRFASDNVSQYAGKDGAWGFVDVIHALRPISVGMLARAKRLPAFGGALHVSTLEAEDVIGLKVQAMANDPERTHRDMADIESLMAVHRDALDWSRLEEYFSLFRLEHVFSKMKGQFTGARDA